MNFAVGNQKNGLAPYAVPLKGGKYEKFRVVGLSRSSRGTE